jgi:hypothetical protein
MKNIKNIHKEQHIRHAAITMTLIAACMPAFAAVTTFTLQVQKNGRPWTDHAKTFRIMCTGSFNFLSFAKLERQQVANEESMLVCVDVEKKWEQVKKEYNLKIL